MHSRIAGPATDGQSPAVILSRLANRENPNRSRVHIVMVISSRISGELRRDQIPEAADIDPIPEIRKQISLLLPLSHWKAIRLEAARRKTPMTAIVSEWVRPHINQLLHHDTHRSHSG